MTAAGFIGLVVFGLIGACVCIIFAALVTDAIAGGPKH